MSRFGLRTETAWDYEDGTPWRNLRYVKWGPKGGVWERRFAQVAAHGPPMEEQRSGMCSCWLCNAKLTVHKRKWTRPGWTRRVGWSRRLLPYERVENKDNVVIFQRGKEEVAWYHRMQEEPSSQLDMTIYSCPNGCDADDTLQALLDQTDHTGPEQRPWESRF